MSCCKTRLSTSRPLTDKQEFVLKYILAKIASGDNKASAQYLIMDAEAIFDTVAKPRNE